MSFDTSCEHPQLFGTRNILDNIKADLRDIISEIKWFAVESSTGFYIDWFKTLVFI
jgi:hypothetical protein